MAGHVAGAPGISVLVPCAAQFWRFLEDLEVDRARQVFLQFICWLLISVELYRTDRLAVDLPMRIPDILVAHEVLVGPETNHLKGGSAHPAPIMVQRSLP